MIRCFIAILLLGYGVASTLSLNSRVVVFPSPVSSNLDDGYILASAYLDIPDIVLSTSYNYKADWSIFINSSNNFFFPNINEKKSTDLLWKISNEPESSYRSVTESAELLFSGYGSREIEVNFKLLIDWEDSPENYFLDVNFFLKEKTNDRMIQSKGRPIAR